MSSTLLLNINLLCKIIARYLYFSILSTISPSIVTSGTSWRFPKVNIHFDNTLQSLTKQTFTTLRLYSLVNVINEPAHRCGHIIDWVIVRHDDDIHRKSTVTGSLESDHYCTKSYFNVSVSKPSILYRTVRNIAKIDRPSFNAELSSVSEFSSVE